jgi:ferredoxin
MDSTAAGFAFLFMPTTGLDLLVAALRTRGWRVAGAVEAGGAIALRELADGAALARGLQAEQAPGRYRMTRDPLDRYFAWTTGPQAVKPLTFAPSEALWRVSRDAAGRLDFQPIDPLPPQLALIGVRACDLAALALQAAHFKDDPHFARRREALFLVAVQCAHAASTCFCASTGDGPTPQTGFDLTLVELPEGFLVAAGSARGAAVLADLPLAPASAAQHAAAARQAEATRAQQTRRLPAGDLRGGLLAALAHEEWARVAERCLACGNCTAVCPTCFCHAEEDTPDVGGRTSEHVRQWDSCFAEGHGHLHGFNLRPDIRSRYRQWLVHKLATWHDQYGRSGCVGCGRCIAWCPVGIDLTETAARVVAEAGA